MLRITSPSTRPMATVTHGAGVCGVQLFNMRAL